ncbi:ABC transporter substrate-binding protein [Paenibacillus silagei]|uniref:ABC-type glycerol-3-phosphate transport system substrate-binding protein n=1 Tax=Paenibacillus silagei TaxID=1670801 RepID=A0ABS4NMG3_9BACL|nr:extracellular solute-binding protein [Paenibacillus silagei]MBP2110604.1 ABC-type glycerol-3-phosphate transport system substrate-binding protein [Paenibacillus silagei]
MRKKKVLFLLISVLMISALLSACSKNSGKSPEPGTAAPEPGASAGPQPSSAKWQGEIQISLPNASASVWNAVAQAYMAINPGVKVKVDHKPQEGYKEWLNAQFAAGTPEVDLITNNEILNLAGDKKFVDYYPYFDKNNPYTGKDWKDSFDLGAMGINLDGIGVEDHLWNLNFESVQIVWVYNKEIFRQAGVTETPKTFSDLTAAFDKIKAAGYIPLGLAGDSNSMWSSTAGWLVRIYADQYMRDFVNITRSQPQDYTFLPEVDDKWAFEPKDPYNDSNSKVTKNPLRAWKAIKDKSGPFKVAGNPAWAAYSENLKKLFSYTPDGFFGVKDTQAYQLFLTGKAATMLSTPGSYWKLPKDFSDEEKTGAQGGVKPFEYGFFNMPSMEGPQVQGAARTIQIPVGSYGIVNKSAEQNALNMDFMMFLTSPEGYKVYVEAIQKSPDASLDGAPALKDITLPDEMTAAFADFAPIGNTEGYDSAANVLARGLWDYQPSIQDWVGSVQKYFAGKISTDQYLNELQANIDKYFDVALKERKMERSDLDTPEKRPPARN